MEPTPPAIRSRFPVETVDVDALERELAEAVRGEVRFDDGSRALYSTDASNYRQVPIGVVVPRSVDDVVATVAVCRRHGAPITPRGGGTSLAGQTCNVAVVIDFSQHLNRVLEIDPARRIARVQPGANLDVLRDAAAHHGLTFGPDPSTHDRNTLGGMIGNDSCGVHSVMSQLYGPGPLTHDQVESLEILTYDGERFAVGPTSDRELEAVVAGGGPRGDIYGRLRALRDRWARQIRDRTPHIPRRVSGYNLEALLPENGCDVARALVGSEGTCVIVLEATVRLIPARPSRALVVLGYPSVFEAADHVTEIVEYGPVGLEGLDDKLVAFMRKKGIHPRDVDLLPPGRGWLLVEFGEETRAEARARASRLVAALERAKDAPSTKLFDDPAEERTLWKVRESGLGATSHVPGMPESHPGWEDAAVPPARLGRYLRDFRRLLDRFGYDCALYGHFGQGCVHCRIDFEMRTREGVRHMLAFLEQAADLVVSHGGSLSGEHGDGQARAALLSRMYGDEMVRAFREFKAIWDPRGRMNPGKVVDPWRPDENLRMGPDYAPWTPATRFRFPDDGGSFAQAAARCVGVGLCRRDEGGVMCPSYQVTREERYSTRGRARLLFEMLQGDVLRRGWREDSVREALDLCLACKGCRHECPVQVDMATYKAEFLSHHYRHRPRPRTAYGMGLVYWWARAASKAPRLANLVTQTEPLASVFKRVGGIAPERRIPRFAGETLTHWLRAREAPSAAPDAGRRVLLWPDTFHNFLHPHVGRAAVRVLEDAGCEVTIPPRPLCCGRPLYDWGMLDLARRLWRQVLDTLRPAIRAGVPVVGLEPSCVAAFRDELCGLFPHDEDARRLARQTWLLSEWLEKIDYRPPRLGGAALVQAHCHHRAVLDLDAELAVLDRLGLDLELPDAGCCGMAGAFGFDRRHYDVSVACGERVLLPKVRMAPAETLVIADGFSCREQIEQTTGRRPLHLAEVIDRALDARGD